MEGDHTAMLAAEKEVNTPISEVDQYVFELSVCHVFLADLMCLAGALERLTAFQESSLHFKRLLAVIQ